MTNIATIATIDVTAITFITKYHYNPLPQSSSNSSQLTTSYCRNCHNAATLESSQLMVDWSQCSHSSQSWRSSHRRHNCHKCHIVNCYKCEPSEYHRRLTAQSTGQCLQMLATSSLSEMSPLSSLSLHPELGLWMRKAGIATNKMLIRSSLCEQDETNANTFMSVYNHIDVISLHKSHKTSSVQNTHQK